jgi:hypothetical protein
MAKAGGPVRDCQPRVIAGDKPAGHNQQKSQHSDKDGKAMMSGVVRRRGQNSSRKLSILSFSPCNRVIGPSDHLAIWKNKTLPLITLMH